jgi:replicative DNA helicase
MTAEEWNEATPARRREKGRLDPDTHRLPPHSIEAEHGLLGCVLLGGRETLLEATEFIRHPDDFYDLRHRAIWLAVLRMDERNEPINNLIAVQQTLRDSNELEGVGGLAYLSELLDAVPADFDFYAVTVRDRARSRRMLRALIRGQAMIHEEQADIPLALDAIERAVLDANDEPEGGVVIPMIERARLAIAAIDLAFEHRNKGLMSGLQTHFSYLDKKTTGPHPGQLWLIGGRPSTGKTSLAVSMILNMAVKGQLKVGFLSLEMSGEEITMRMLCNLARANMKQIHSGMITERDKNALMDALPILAKAAIFIDDTPALTPQALRMRGRRLVSRYGCQILYIDHLHEVIDPAHRGDEQKDAKAAVIAAKWLAKVLRVPVVALAQLNREFEKEKGRRTPRMSDLRGHGANEQVADFIGIIHRDHKREEENNADYDENSDVWLNTLEVCKQRNGPTGPVQFVFDRPTMRYEDATFNTGNYASGQKRQEQQDEL